MNEVSIDVNIAKGIVEMLGQLQLDYMPSKARNVMVEHVSTQLQAAEAAVTTEDESKEDE